MPCSICGIHGHNKKTCGKSNNTMPKNSAFYGDFKQNVKNNCSYYAKCTIYRKVFKLFLEITLFLFLSFM